MSVCDMMTIAYKGLGSSIRGLVLWQTACLALIWVLWRERNARIFQDKVRILEVLWYTIYFLASFWAFCTTFKDIPLNVVQLHWLLVCRSKGVGWQGEVVLCTFDVVYWVFWGYWVRTFPLMLVCRSIVQFFIFRMISYPSFVLFKSLFNILNCYFS